MHLDTKASLLFNRFIPSPFCRDVKEQEIGKDFYIDSTFKADNYKLDDINAHSETRHSETQSNTATQEAADKYPSPEPLSEESDTLSLCLF